VVGRRAGDVSPGAAVVWLPELDELVQDGVIQLSGILSLDDVPSHSIEAKRLKYSIQLLSTMLIT
jgi:hypothetical protein